ncbi:MAG: DUF3575 domain-containing protein [Leeuwenhoekiella sp.]
MKNKLTFILLTLLAALQLQAQEFSEPSAKTDFKQAFKILPVNAAVKEFILGYEHQITKKSSLEFYAFYDQFRFKLSTPDLLFYETSLSAGYRYYFTKKEDRLQGFYGRASVRGSYNFGNSESIDGVFSLGLEAYTGYQWELNSFLKGFVIDVSGGVFANGPLTDLESRDNVDEISIDPKIIFSIGYSF